MTLLAPKARHQDFVLSAPPLGGSGVGSEISVRQLLETLDILWVPDVLLYPLHGPLASVVLGLLGNPKLLTDLCDARTRAERYVQLAQLPNELRCCMSPALH